MIDVQDAERAIASLAAEQAAKGNTALTMLAWLCRRKSSLTLTDGNELHVRPARDQDGTTRLNRALVVLVDTSGRRRRTWTITQRGRIEVIVDGQKKKKKRKRKDETRKAVNLTLDPRLRKAAETLSDSLGVRFVRLVDFALRQELARHGVDVESAKGDAALEAMIEQARAPAEHDE